MDTSVVLFYADESGGSNLGSTKRPIVGGAEFQLSEGREGRQAGRQGASRRRSEIFSSSIWESGRGTLQNNSTHTLRS